MEKIPFKMNGPIILIIGIIALIVFRYSVFNHNTNEIDDFMKYGMFTLGKVVAYNAKTYGPNGVGSSPSIRFSYRVQGVEYLEESDYNVPNENGPNEGCLFMAIYLPNNPRKCILLLNYPVKDSVDYEKYIEEFKTQRPDNLTK